MPPAIPARLTVMYKIDGPAHTAEAKEFPGVVGSGENKLEAVNHLIVSLNEKIPPPKP